MPVRATIATKDGRLAVNALLGQTAPNVTDGRGGWSAVDRPRQPGVIEWVGTKPQQATLTLMLDGWRAGLSVQSAIDRINRMAPAGPEQEPTQPVYVSNAWPIIHTTPWMIQSVSWGVDEMLRDAKNRIVRVEVTIELIELRLAEAVIAKKSAAKRSKSKSGKSAKEKQRRVTVKKGDTLSSIAAKYLGSASKWTLIAKENGLRSPKSIKVGQVLRLP